MKSDDLKVIQQDMRNQCLVEIIEQGANECLVEFNLRVSAFTSDIKHIILDVHYMTTVMSDGSVKHSVLIMYNFAEVISRLGKRTRKLYVQHLTKNMPRPIIKA